MISHVRLAALPALALAVFAVSGCQKQDSVTAENESAEAVAKKVANSNIKPKPGRWESTMSLEAMDMPDMPPQAQEMMKKQLGKGQTFVTCLTPEQVDKPNADFFQGKAESGCTYDKFTMSGGVIDAKMHCDKAGAKREMTMAGTYGEENYAIKMNMKGEALPGKPMAMTMSIASRRIGECNGKEKL